MSPFGQLVTSSATLTRQNFSKISNFFLFKSFTSNFIVFTLTIIHGQTWILIFSILSWLNITHVTYGIQVLIIFLFTDSEGFRRVSEWFRDWKWFSDLCLWYGIGSKTKFHKCCFCSIVSCDRFLPFRQSYTVISPLKYKILVYRLYSRQPR